MAQCESEGIFLPSAKSCPTLEENSCPEEQHAPTDYRHPACACFVVILVSLVSGRRLTSPRCRALTGHAGAGSCSPKTNGKDRHSHLGHCRGRAWRLRPRRRQQGGVRHVPVAHRTGTRQGALGTRDGRLRCERLTRGASQAAKCSSSSRIETFLPV